MIVYVKKHIYTYIYILLGLLYEMGVASRYIYIYRERDFINLSINRNQYLYVQAPHIYLAAQRHERKMTRSERLCLDIHVQLHISMDCWYITSICNGARTTGEKEIGRQNTGTRSGCLESPSTCTNTWREWTDVTVLYVIMCICTCGWARHRPLWHKRDAK